MATAIIEVTGTLPVSQVQLSSGSQSVTLNAVVQEVLKGSSDADTLTLSGSAVAGDEFDGVRALIRWSSGDASNQIIVDNVENIQGGSGDDRIEIASPGTGGTSITTGGGSDIVALGGDFEFVSAALSGSDLIVSANYTDPGDAAAETKRVQLQLQINLPRPFSQSKWIWMVMERSTLTQRSSH